MAFSAQSLAKINAALDDILSAPSKPSVLLKSAERVRRASRAEHNQELQAFMHASLDYREIEGFTRAMRFED